MPLTEFAKVVGLERVTEHQGKTDHLAVLVRQSKEVGVEPALRLPNRLRLAGILRSSLAATRSNGVLMHLHEAAVNHHYREVQFLHQRQLHPSRTRTRARPSALRCPSPTTRATEAVAGRPPPPLTAVSENAATFHDGASVFTFELRSSEKFAVSYKRLRDHAFTVSGGAVRKAKRLEQGSNIGWRITISPDGNGDVNIVLPETTDCNDDRDVCTEDGRKLSHRLELTVAGTSP